MKMPLGITKEEITDAADRLMDIAADLRRKADALEANAFKLRSVASQAGRNRETVHG